MVSYSKRKILRKTKKEARRLTHRNHTITNAWELLAGNETDWLLAVNGFSQTGGDYACFCHFLQALDRSECLDTAALSRLLGAEKRLTLSNANTIWRQVAQRLLLEDAEEAVRDECLADWRRELKTPRPVVLPQETVCQRLVDVEPLLLPSGSSWTAWEREATLTLETALGEDALPMLTLPSGFSPMRVSLYHAERMLAGESEPPAMWRTQLAMFLLSFCEKKGLRPVLRIECEQKALLELLDRVSHRCAKPAVILQATSISFENLLELCQCVRLGSTSPKEGEPPVLWTPLGTGDESVVPRHLTVRLPNQTA